MALLSQISRLIGILSRKGLKLFACCSLCGPCGREAGEWAGSGQQGCYLSGLSTRPEGRSEGLVHKVLGNIAETELRSSSSRYERWNTGLRDPGKLPTNFSEEPIKKNPRLSGVIDIMDT